MDVVPKEGLAPLCKSAQVVDARYHAGAKKLAAGNFFLTLSSSLQKIDNKKTPCVNIVVLLVPKEGLEPS